MEKISFGLRGHDIGNNFEEMLCNAKAHNVKKLQFALAKTVNNINFHEAGYDSKISQSIKKSLEENNLEVSVLGCYINPVERNEEELEKSLTLFENFIKYAKDFDAGVIGTETGFYQDVEFTHSEENYQFFLNNLRRLVAVAEKHKVTIGIEPVTRFTVRSVEVMARVLDDIKSDSLAVIFDLSNITTPENYTEQHKIMDSAFELFGDKIKTIHLKDFKIEDNERKFAVAGTGLYDIRYLFGKLEKLSKMPDIILDETPLAEYENSVKNIEAMI